MCGRSFTKHKRGFGYGAALDGVHVRHYRGTWSPHWGSHGRFFGLDVSEMGRRGQIVAALVVLAPVLLSGVALAFTPVWWIFTTYGWVVFPAFGFLLRGFSGTPGSGRRRSTSVGGRSQERELLDALRVHGQLSPVVAATETSLSVERADAMLGDLAEAGHLEVRARGGGLFYALWGAGDGRPSLTKEG